MRIQFLQVIMWALLTEPRITKVVSITRVCISPMLTRNMFKIAFRIDIQLMQPSQFHEALLIQNKEQRSGIGYGPSVFV